MAVIFKYRFHLLLIAFLLPFSTYPQGRHAWVIGKVTDASTGMSLHHTNITIAGTYSGTATGKNGWYKLKVKRKKDITVNYSFVGYESHSEKISLNALRQTDTLAVYVKLKMQPRTLPVFSVGAPETVFASPKFSISDYEFLDDRFIFLAYERTLKRGSKVILADRYEKQLSHCLVPGDEQAVELFKDYLGRVNVICKNSVYRVMVDGKNIGLTEMPQEYFNAYIKPCIDTLDGETVYSDYRWHYPEFNYYIYDPVDSSSVKIKNIIDKQLHRLYRYEYYFLNPREKLQARKTALRHGFDKHEVAAWMSGFPNSLYYTPLYAPLFVADDTIMVFDHYTNRLYRFDALAHPIDSIAINYHQKPTHREWKRQLLMDEQNDRIYSLYQKNGYYYLKRIHTGTGKTGPPFRLSYKYAEQVKVKDDYVYYIYRPYESVQKKYLYRELIIGN